MNPYPFTWSKRTTCPRVTDINLTPAAPTQRAYLTPADRKNPAQPFGRSSRGAHYVYEQALGAERAQAVPLTSLGLPATRDRDQPVGNLSVGERRRLLSPRLSDALEAALGTGLGALVIASGDRWLRSCRPDRELRL